MAICSRSARRAALYALGVLVSPSADSAQGRAAPDNARLRVQAEGPAAMERLKAATARAKQGTVGADITLPRSTDEQRRRAFEGLAGRIRSPEMETQVKDALARATDAAGVEREAMARRIGQALGLEAPDVQALAGAVKPTTSRGWVPVLFASASMPVATLRTYAGQLERVGGVIALRGMVGGMTKVRPTAKLSAEILRIDPGCDGPACAMRDVQLIIDPLLFRQHHVTQVPALAMVPGDPTLPYCERDDASPVAAHIIYGDAALSGLLTEYARLGGKEEVADAQARLDRR